ncbi:hypothetical protein ACFQUU_28725 [Herbaspirillum sp. GCM10030257]|uniref:hypothetical protein n=1 Tax=Herbaspirillum sp. GCM10030257 TaxID=3273393 RepID=UPI00361A1F70
MDVIIHADATSFIHIEMLAAIHTLHNMRNTGRFNGRKGESDSEPEREDWLGVGVSRGVSLGMDELAGAVDYSISCITKDSFALL